MCEILEIPRGLYYYHTNKRNKENDKSLIFCEDKKLTSKIIEIFKKSKNAYGTRRIKAILNKEGYKVSRRKISKIMKENQLISCYTKSTYKQEKSKSNEEKIENIVARKFSNRKELEVVVSDLTYVRVGQRWDMYAF